MTARATRSGEPRDTLTRERVLRAAIELADERGIDALTMRELARKLGVEGGSLYYHVAGKGDLLDGMTDGFVSKQLERIYEEEPELNGLWSFHPTTEVRDSGLGTRDSKNAP